MSINALGFASNAQALPQLASIVPPSDKPKTPAEEAKARAEAAAFRQKTTLDEVREKGLYKYAQEQKFKALEEKIAKEVKAERGINDNMYAAMSAEEKSSLQQEISKRIQDAMKNALEGESQKAMAEGRPAQPMIIDISV
jgi:hypothetical protein